MKRSTSKWWRAPRTIQARKLMSFKFRDRAHAGSLLADKLEPYATGSAILVLALVRGGVPVGLEVATRLRAPLDVFLVRKLGAPAEKELAIGAIASGGVKFLNHDLIRSLSISPSELEAIVERESVELQRREAFYRAHHTGVEARGREVILVDDGLATGASMRAAIAAVGEKRPARIIVGVPVSARETAEELTLLADAVVCVQTPANFHGVGQWYEDFSQIDDEEVRACLARFWQRAVPSPATAGLT